MAIVFQPQGPANRCVIDGKLLGWLSCTAYAGAMVVDESTDGRMRPTGCEIREQTGDTVGGLSLPQVVPIMERYGIDVEMHVGSNVASAAYAKAQFQNWRSGIVQIDTAPLLDTPFRSTNGSVAHAIVVDDDWQGNNVRVYDPAAMGQRDGFDTAPSYWPWELVVECAGALRPWADERVLGTGRMYVAFGPSNPPPSPIVNYTFRGRPTKPHPDLIRGNAGEGRYTRIRRMPRRIDRYGRDTRVDLLKHDGKFAAWQVTTAGESINGNSRWWGDVTGKLWVHDLGVREGGGTM